MNIKPIISPETNQIAAASQMRDDARERRREDGSRERKGHSPPAVPEKSASHDAEVSDEALRASQSIDSQSVVELLIESPAVKTRTAKAFVQAVSRPSIAVVSDEKKLNKAL